MATLVLEDTPRDHPNAGPPPVTLRAWLREGWAMLLSHPQDFVHCELEVDRWLQVLRRAFESRAVRPLALSRDGAVNAACWTAQLSGDHRRVLLEHGDRATDTLDLNAQQLRLQLDAAPGRCVVILDSLLRRRHTIAYRAVERPPSPLDLLSWIDVARRIPDLARAARGRPKAHRPQGGAPEGQGAGRTPFPGSRPAYHLS